MDGSRRFGYASAGEMEFFLTVAVAHFFAVASPGPDFFLVVRNALRNGRRAGIHSSAGIMLGVGVQLVLCLSGLSLVLTRAPGAMDAIGLAGAGYLIWLGWHAIMDSGSPFSPPAGRISASPWRSPVWEGFVCNLSNPKAILFFLGLFAVLLTPEVPVFWRVASGVEVLMVNLLWFSFVAVVVARTGRHPRFARFQKAGLALTGLILWLLAARLLWVVLWAGGG